MKKLQIIVALVTATLSVSAIAAKQPNIVFIFSDDHAVQSIGAYGSKINRTPNIDRLADTGVVFENSFCGNSICGPSRATVLTGLHSHKNGFLGNFSKAFDGSQTTFPKLLQNAGYQTAMIGKWHLKSEPTGFDYWKILPGQGSYYNPVFLKKGGKEKYTGYCTTITTDLALKWLAERDPSKPFLLMCQHKAPHRTWAPDIKHLDRYADGDIPEPSTLFDAYENRSASLAANAMSIDQHFYYNYDLKVREPVPFATKRETHLKANEYPRMTPDQKAAWDAAFGPRNQAFLDNPPTGKELVRWKYQRYIKNYLRCIDSVDENVGRVIDYLEANGLRDNTLIVYSSDQGFYLGEHGWYDKRWMFEESLRMPLLMSWPETIKPKSRYKELVQNIDYAPTFLAVAGAPVPPTMQGRSLLPLLTDHATASTGWRDTVYYHYYEHGGEHRVPRHEGVRTDRHKLINFYSNDGINLFDLEKDANEMRSVHADPEYAAVLTDMKQRLDRMRKHYGLPPRHGEKRP
jgi:arylsulfatase A-like enzyme